MENTNEVTLKLTQKELVILHTALCQHRGKVGELISQLAGMGLATDEVRAFSNQLGDLSHRMCDLMTD